MKLCPRFAVVLAVLSCLAAGARAEERAARPPLDRAAALLFSPTNSQREIQTGLGALLEAIVDAQGAAALPAEFKAKMAAALQEYRRSSTLNPTAAHQLGEGYRLLHAGKHFEVPESLTTLPAVTEEARRRLGSARRLLAQGNAAKAVGLLLEVTLMFVTPVQ